MVGKPSSPRVERDVKAVTAIDFVIIVLVLYVFVFLIPKQLLRMMVRRIKTP